LTGSNADLFFATNRCFICFHSLHRSEVCPQRSLGMLFCKRLDDPHRACLSVSICVFLMFGSSQDGMRTVPDWSSRRGGRQNGRRKNKSNRRPLPIAPMMVGVLLRVTIGGLVQTNHCSP
jgi:hypothetical protein